MNVLLIDNFDSFTFMLRDYLMQAGATCEVIRNSKHPDQIDWKKYNAIVIGPGPETPSRSGFLMQYLDIITIMKLPVLGICLGHQAIGEKAGAKLIKSSTPKHGKTDIMHHQDDVLFNQIPKDFTGVRYHSLELIELPESLTITALSEKNEVMAISHNSLPQWGIQFHPESCKTENGMRIIKNFLVLAANYQ